MKKVFMILCVVVCGYSCSNNDPNAQKEGEIKLNTAVEEAAKTEVHGTEVKEGDIKLSNPLDANMIASGKKVYDLKCQSCHKLTDEKLVGPGWKGVTKKREPVWIINMIVNVDMMLEKDAEAQKLLELCLVRMPNQSVTNEEARGLLEFMRQNDGEK
ncbi:MAG: c-type cytochrome [Bacteroidia bacterium]